MQTPLDEQISELFQVSQSGDYVKGHLSPLSPKMNIVRT